MGSIHWGRSREWRQTTRLERYADDSWMALLALPFRCWIALKGRSE